MERVVYIDERGVKKVTEGEAWKGEEGRKE